jgi:bifunctional UDP-N-acetylglucosamine pyrophosphorylase/glucosamine-1-phosphate N-acetyltransferase
MKDLAAVILAAGQGTRMKSDLAKVLHPVRGMPMVTYVIRAVRQAGSRRIILVVGYQKERVMETLGGEGVEFVVQNQQLGTAHALMQTRETLAGYHGDLLVLAGDTPLLLDSTVSGLLDGHRAAGAVATVLTAVLEDPSGYGRILRTPENLLDAIVEDKDATPEQRAIGEINTGAYCFQSPLIFEILDQIGRDNRQGEFYLTDALSILRARGQTVAAVVAVDEREVLGVNSVEQLAQAEDLMVRRGALETEKKG